MKRRSFLVASVATVAGLYWWKPPRVVESVKAVALSKKPISLSSYLRANPALRAAWEKTVESPWVPYLPSDHELAVWQRRQEAGRIRRERAEDVRSLVPNLSECLRR